MKKTRIEYIAKISVLGVISALLMLLEFPLPFAPSFYELDLSEIAVLIAGFSMGPLAGVLTELVKIILNLLMNWTITAGVGEFANLIMGISFVLPAAFIYKYKKTLKGAIVGMTAGVMSLVIIGALVNYFIMIPAFVKFAGFPMDAIIGMGTAINPSIDSLFDLILLATVPFNLLKGVICSVATALIYKRVSPILHKQYHK